MAKLHGTSSVKVLMLHKPTESSMKMMLRRLKTVSSTFQDLDFDVSLLPLVIHVMLADPAIQSRLPLGRNKQISIYLSLDATIMVYKNCPITGEHVGINFVTQ